MDAERLAALRKLAHDALNDNGADWQLRVNVRQMACAVYEMAVEVKRLHECQEHDADATMAQFERAEKAEAECQRLEAMQANLIHDAGAAQHECARLRGIIAEAKEIADDRGWRNISGILEQADA